MMNILYKTICAFLLGIIFVIIYTFNFNFAIIKEKNGNDLIPIINDYSKDGLSIFNDYVSKVLNKSKENMKNGDLNKYTYVEEKGQEIIQCFNNKDKVGLNNLFCEKVKNSKYLSEEIDFIFDCFDKNGGINIESGQWISPYGHGSNDYVGKTVEYYSCEYSGDIKIGKKTYNLNFTAYQILKKHKEYEGIHCIYFIEKVSSDVLDKIAQNIDTSNNKKVYLGIDLINNNYQFYKYKSMLPSEFYKNDLYLIPNNLEDDR